MSAQFLLHSLFKYKAWANRELFAEFGKIDSTASQSARHAAIRLLNHILVVDRIFAAHLCGEEHNYVGTNTLETPSLDELRTALTISDSWYVEYVGKLSSEALNEEVRFKFVDGAMGCMTREEMLAHVATHGDYHRGAVGRMLPEVSVEPFTVYLHRAEPRRREHP